jgi:hypothetical protein
MAKKSKPYNGHESYNAWNVSLWINNDEGLYRLAQECVNQTKTLDEAASLLFSSLPSKTPDGVRYSKHTVRLALRDFE